MSYGENYREMYTKSPVNRKVQLAFGSVILALLGVSRISYRATVMSSESDQWVRHTTGCRVEQIIGRNFSCFFSSKDIKGVTPVRVFP